MPAQAISSRSVAVVRAENTIARLDERFSKSLILKG